MLGPDERPEATSRRSWRPTRTARAHGCLYQIERNLTESAEATKAEATEAEAETVEAPG